MFSFQDVILLQKEHYAVQYSKNQIIILNSNQVFHKLKLKIYCIKEIGLKFHINQGVLFKNIKQLDLTFAKVFP